MVNFLWICLETELHKNEGRQVTQLRGNFPFFIGELEGMIFLLPISIFSVVLLCWCSLNSLILSFSFFFEQAARLPQFHLPGCFYHQMVIAPVLTPEQSCQAQSARPLLARFFLAMSSIPFTLGILLCSCLIAWTFQAPKRVLLGKLAMKCVKLTQTIH